MRLNCVCIGGSMCTRMYTVCAQCLCTNEQCLSDDCHHLNYLQIRLPPDYIFKCAQCGLHRFVYCAFDNDAQAHHGRPLCTIAPDLDRANTESDEHNQNIHLHLSPRLLLLLLSRDGETRNRQCLNIFGCDLLFIYRCSCVTFDWRRFQRGIDMCSL